MAHGRPAAEALAAGVARAKAEGGPLAPVTVVVPSNFAGLAARRLLGSGRVGPGGVANVAFLTPFRLAELVAADLLDDRRPLTNPVLASAVRQSLADDPGPFAPVADHLATEQALAALYGELSHLSDASLAGIERCAGPAGEAVRQHRAIAAHLTAFHDEDDVADAAARRPDLAMAFRPFGQLIWYLPEPCTPALTRFLGAAMAAVQASLVLALTGDADADEAVINTCRRAGVPLDGPPQPVLQPPVASHVISVTDADEEVRAVVRGVASLAEAGVELDRIGIFHPVPDPYLRTLRQQLEAAGIPANGPSHERLVDSVAGRTLLAALALPSQRWRRDRVLALVSGAPVRAGGKPARPTTWEVLSRRAGVVTDLADWRRKLDIFEQRLTAQAVELAPDVPGGLRKRIERDRQDVAALAGFVSGLADAVSKVEASPTWAAKIVAAAELLRQLLGSDGDRQGWPDEERAAAERVEDSLARLAALDELEPRPANTVFRRALAAELDVRRGRHGRFGRGVVYGPLSGAIGADLDAVFVLGMAEGSCPAPRRDDAMLPDVVRKLAPEGELTLRTRSLHDQHRWYLAALAAAPADRRWLLHPRGDLRGGRQRLPSRWLLDTVSALAGHPVHSTDFGSLEAPLVDIVASFAGGLVTAGCAASPEERDLMSVAAHVAVGGDPAGHPAAAPVQRALLAQRARRSGSFTEWDGNLAGQNVPSPARGEVLSATRLERWAACGFRYLLGDVLGLGDRDEPERVVELGALDRGSMVHTVLERFFLEAIAEGPPHPDVAWSPAHHDRLLAIGREVAAEYEEKGLTGRPLRWRLQQEQLSAMLDDFLVADDRHRAVTRSRPVRVELPFGLDGAEPVSVQLGDGRSILFRGRADRVDVTDDGHHLVSDYKTGKGKGYEELVEDPVRGGTTLQLGLYSEAAIQLMGAPAASGHYWMLRDESVSERHGYAWTAARRDRFVEVVAAIVDGIEAGTFAAEPGGWDSFRRTHSNCAYCDFDRLCPVDRGEHAQAKAASPELQIRRRLSLPLEEDR